ncbi:acetate CoA-transferase subunit beta [Leminorella grimontii]|uniref:Acetate CoA-transferase subunit beta n=1 Tax=Leminorella grimontii TaxID=82981 RepID=A0AAV5N7K3_9GAMM|nr:3-oxoacid CoA-transferase subunit B [Leminorella grimontii]KFC93087.1 acetyl-CoA:acetoacetyl-CoA transferase, beta subunit [Leminorella grimontii ATCC 33999 = DSM 5078]GKX57453.1 acetate CoA-transferase subunit beta [Leminorella grimontii]GKX61196.1 acetate CoA-transferase subunit beta [Leminorella grimontii]VFS62045.1 Acetate CoA-transferase subunit beta [Leminorella grimontii]
MSPKAFIAKRVALELKDGDVVNLGIGLPTMVAHYLPDGVDIVLQSENGFVGICPADEENPDPDVANAGGQPCGIIPGGATFDSAFSFALIRGGHVDACVLGGLEVDQHGNLANWMIPGKMVPGMGGAMDLVTGSRKVIVAMEHCAKSGASKILRSCTLPLTACGCVSTVVTELAVFQFINGQLTLTEHAPGVSVEQIRQKTEAEFVVSSQLREMLVMEQELS